MADRSVADRGVADRGVADRQMTTPNPTTEITSPVRLIQSPAVIFIGS